MKVMKGALCDPSAKILLTGDVMVSRLLREVVDKKMVSQIIGGFCKRSMAASQVIKQRSTSLVG